MIPINFMLNFQLSSSKAAKGIKDLSSSTEDLAKSFEQVRQNYGSWYSSVIDSTKVTSKNVRGVGNEFIKAFNSDLLNTFGNGIKDVSQEFQNMYRDKEFKKIEDTFEGLSGAVKHFVPYVRMGDNSLQKMLESLAEIRTKEGGKGIELINDQLVKFGKASKDNLLNPKQLKEISEVLEKFAKSKKTSENIKQVAEALKDVNEQVDDLIAKKEAQEKLNSTWSTLLGFEPTIEGFAKVVMRASGAITVLSDAWEAQDQIVKTVTQLGMVTGNLSSNMFAMVKPTQDYTSAVVSLGLKTQVSMKEASQAMGELAAIRVTDNINDLKDLGIQAVQMSQAFGMSTGEAAEFMKSLYKIGGLTKGDITKATNELANTQKQFGLTAQEAQSATTQIGSMARTMKVFGGRVSDVKALTSGVAKLTVAFTKAGLSADQANDMLTSMLDPSRLEDNILLFQGLGMSAGDAIGMMTGDTKNLNNMNEKMVSLAKNLKAQYGGNVFALQEMAKQYGMTLEQVQQLSSLNAKDLKATKEKASLEEQANKARASMKGSWDMIMNSLNVIMQAFIMPLFNFIAPITKGIANIITKFMGLADSLKKLGPIGKGIAQVFEFAFGAAVLVGILGIGNALKRVLLPGLGQTKGLLGMLKDGLSGIAKKAKDAVSGLLKLKKTNVEGGAAGATKGAGVSKGGSMPAENAKKSGFLEQLKNVSPAQLLALGAAIFFIAAGIALITLSVAVLAKAIKDLNPEQISAMMKVIGVIMGGMIVTILAFSVAILALGAAGSVSALGILAIGAAIFLVGAGIAVIVLSIAYLVKTIGESSQNMQAFGIVVAQLLPMFLNLSLGIMAVGAALIMLGTYAVAGLAGLAVFAGMAVVMALLIPITSKLGEGFSNIGLGIKNMADYGAAAAANLLTVRDAMNSIGGNFAASFISQINQIADAMSRISTGSVMMNTVLKVIGAPEQGSGETPTSASTDAITKLISESNSYLSKIADNTETLVKILNKGTGNVKVSGNEEASNKQLFAKEKSVKAI